MCYSLKSVDNCGCGDPNEQVPRMSGMVLLVLIHGHDGITADVKTGEGIDSKLGALRDRPRFTWMV